jgi:hypothetical protein
MRILQVMREDADIAVIITIVILLDVAAIWLFLGNFR